MCVVLVGLDTIFGGGALIPYRSYKTRIDVLGDCLPLMLPYTAFPFIL